MDLDGTRMLATILAIGSGIWVGGIATVAIVAASSRGTVTAADRVALFRVFGRRFAVFVGVAALLLVLPALVLATIDPRPLTAGTLVLALGLLLLTSIGILQARRMSAMRSAAASGSDEPGRLGRNAAVAAILRSVIGLASLVLMVLAVLLAARG